MAGPMPGAQTTCGESASPRAVVEPPPQSAGEPDDGAEAAGSTAGRINNRVRRQSIAVMILATLAVLYSLHFARAVLMPVAMAFLFALVLRPFIRQFHSYRIPVAVSAAVTLLVALILFGGTALYIIEPANDWIKSAPRRLHEAGQKLNVVRKQIEQINRASKQVQDLAEGKVEPTSRKAAPFPFAPEPSDREDEAGDFRDVATPSQLDAASFPFAGRDVLAESAVPADAEGDNELVPDSDQAKTGVSDVQDEEPVAVEVKQTRLVTGLTFLSSTGSVLAEIVVTIVLTYFLLSSGDMLINNVLRILPTFREKRSTVELVYTVERGISSYLLTVTLINTGLGLAIGMAMWVLGLPNAALWGAMGAFLNFVPFLGALVGTAVVFLVAVLSFESLAYAAVIPLVYFSLTFLEGNLITPHLLGRSMSLNPIMVFLSLTFWGWMWGIAGAVLAVPILAVVKVGCDQFDRARPISTLLGGSPPP